MVAFTKVISVFLSVITLIMSFLGINIAPQEDVIILCTNDVHCAVDTNIGYAGIAAYKKKMEKETPYVTLVDGGDAVQGAAIGTVSNGSYLIDIMNYVGYELSAVGNHELDYGIEQFRQYTQQADFQYLGCNLTFSGKGNNCYRKVAPYKIKEYGDIKVAFIGVTTPYTATTAAKPRDFRDDSGNIIYGFSENNLYEQIQVYIDVCEGQGADCIVLLGHTGISTEDYGPYSSTAIIENTAGIDVFFDAHDHILMEPTTVIDENGDSVILSSAGTELKSFEKLTVKENGNISVELISDYTEKDSDTQKYIDSIKELYESELNKVVAYNPIDLTIYENGIRKIRCREMPIGNLVADSYREVAQADIAFVNAGGIRADLNAGDVTYNDLIAVHPFGNSLCSVKATGQEILDALEFSYRFVQDTYQTDSAAVGESGAFLHISGMKLTVDTSVPSPITTDSFGNFTGINGERRVKNVTVLENGSYVPIDPEKTYTVASHKYLLKNCGDGYTMFTDNEFIIDEGPLDYDALISYFTNSENEYLTANYSSVQNRVTVL